MIRVSNQFPAIGMLLFCLAAQAEQPAIHERIEWTDVWVTNADSEEAPRVLLVGDSIVRGYFDGVEKALGDGVNLARFTTSKFAGHPDYLEELGLLLRRYDFDVIHLNNGLHGFDYTEEHYREALKALVEYVEENARGARVIWCMSTPIRDADNLAALTERNDRVIERNRIAAEVMAEHDISVNDLYAVVVDYPEYFSKDGVHYNEQGRGVQAKHVAEAIRSGLGATPDSSPEP